MTDKELLELAAKATPGISDGDVLYDMNMGKIWNPLADDGDALRLAVKLNLAISIEDGQSWAHHEQVIAGSPVQHDGKNPYAATRRAIVRAAAAIGEQMP